MTVPPDQPSTAATAIDGKWVADNPAGKATAAADGGRWQQGWFTQPAEFWGSYS